MPWGAVENIECQIDSIAQSWAVLADAPDKTRAEQAVRAAAERLIDRDPAAGAAAYPSV